MDAQPAIDQQSIDKQQIANDFSARMQGILPQDKIDAAVKTIVADTQSYYAHGGLASFIFYVRLSLTLEVNGVDNATYTGNAGGVGTPGGGALIGYVWTDDLQALYANTVSFEYQTTLVATNINFFDGNSNILGYFVGGAVSTVNGIGGGAGTWAVNQTSQ